MTKDSKLWIILRGIIVENPVLILILGTCPTLATTTSVISALSMGIAATIVLICSNIVISALRKIIPDSVRIPCYIVIIAAFVTAVQMLLQAYLPDIYKMLGVYLSLIVVNCIILGRAEMYARKNTIVDSALDGLGMGIGFLVALVLMATMREVFGKGSFADIEIPYLVNYKISLLVEAPGGFLVYGLLIAVMNKLTAKKGGINKKSFACDRCPARGMCGKSSCDSSDVTDTEAVNTTEKEVNENA